jgi:hypothetical protein
MDRILDFDPTARAVEPRLRCPIPPEINPHARYAQASSARWAVQMGLVAYGTPQMVVFERARFAWLVARCYPRASAAQLRLLADWATLIFFYDDLGDTVCGERHERDDAKLVTMHRQIVDALFTGHAPAGDVFCTAMADIRRRLMRMIDPRWLARLAEDLELYLQGVRWEHAVERSGRPLTLAIYRH